MSGAFVREEEGQWLHDEVRSYMHKKEGREVHTMSNGLDYAVGDSKWYIVW